MPKQFWVIGGVYRDPEFQDMDLSTSTVHGPFRDYDEANHVWRERSMETRSQAATRFAIVVSAQNPRASQS
ncbi:MAG: DUF4170 domain-containing protein [Hyphomicrobiales bacterium]|nr:DUF4170 domain-containing protein [Hyphomicrobiales bacterium]